MISSLSQRLDVVYLLGLHVPAFLKAALAEWVGVHVTVADSFPCTSVSALAGRITVVLFVSFVLQLLVLRTKAPVSQ